MDRLISEQAVIDRLSNWYSDMLETGKEHEDLIEVIKAIPSAEPCEDAISRQEVLDYIDKMPSELTADGRRMIRRRTLEEYISDTLSFVKQEPKTGHWIYDRTRDWDGECKYECSECGMGSDVDFAYCMRCGAKMVEPQESEG